MAPRALALLTPVLLAVLTACGSGEPAARPTPQASASTQAPPSGREDVPSALVDMRHPDFPKPLVDPDHIVSGGPPPDGIPAIDAPKFQTASAVKWLDDDEPMLSLTVGKETRAYPLQVMTWHEIVNDTVDGVPVAVTYCPLCNSGVAFERRAAGQVLTFGTSGRLYADNLVMYDRQTESLWPQLTGQAAVGVLTGTRLRAIPMGTVAWDDFRAAHPDALVLSRDTGYERPYGQNPYTGYDDPDGDLLFALPGGEDPRLPAKERVVGIRVGDDSLALRRSLVARDSVVTVHVGGTPVLVWHRPGQASALDQARVADGKDIGTVGVFDPRVDGQRLEFQAVPNGFRDSQTGSTWNVLGEAVGGPLSGRRLRPHRHLDTFWFAWVAFQPDTRLLS
ncbi:MAG: DUF3179 domain-containing protein [Actinomycetota bacterium]|nr:DUF3179 domain-containing protein [Actinomycetota bacterium]